MEVANRKYRFRMLNVSSSRSYLPYLDTGDDLIVIATDSSLTAEPVRVKNFRIGTAERYDFIIDFSKYPVGTQVVLYNGNPPTNVAYENTDKIMLFDVVRSQSDDSEIPAQLSYIPPVSELVAKAVRTRNFHFERINDKWVINGKEWDSNRIDANPHLGDYEIWTLHNVHETWFHPVHIHASDFQIIERNRQAPFPYERGWKDTFYLGTNEAVRVVGQFGPFTGRYVFHCHNSVHEDHDMMTQFEIGQGGPSPFSAPAQPLPAPPL